MTPAETVVVGGLCFAMVAPYLSAAEHGLHILWRGGAFSGIQRVVSSNVRRRTGALRPRSSKGFEVWCLKGTGGNSGCGVPPVPLAIMIAIFAIQRPMVNCAEQ